MVAAMRHFCVEPADLEAGVLDERIAVFYRQPWVRAIQHSAISTDGIMRNPYWQRTLIALVALVNIVLPSISRAEEAEDSRVFVQLVGDAQALEALSGARNRFESVITRDSDVTFAGTVDMDATLASCREEVGVSPTEERNCKLQAARRLFVSEVIIIEMVALEKSADGWELTLDAWDADSNVMTFSTFFEAPKSSRLQAAKAGMSALASGYLCSRGVLRHCVGNGDAGLVETGLVSSSSGEQSCALGLEVSPDTAGRCCWPGQAWSGKECVGTPSTCPAGYRANPFGQTCELPGCKEGRGRAQDGVHCCWPGQAWSASNAKCIGLPKCPEGTYQNGEDCTVDADGDGIVDEQDLCEGEPEDLDGLLDDDGCPEIDADTDGILDTNDTCPSEAEDLDGWDDGDGCFEPDNAWTIAGWGFLGAGGAVFAVAGVHGLLMQQDADQYHADFDAGKKTAPEMVQRWSELEDTKRLNTVIWGVGGVLAVTGALLVVYARDGGDNGGFIQLGLAGPGVAGRMSF